MDSFLTSFARISVLSTITEFGSVFEAAKLAALTISCIFAGWAAVKKDTKNGQLKFYIKDVINFLQ